MKPSTKIWLGCTCVGAMAALGFYLWLPTLPWWIYVIVGVAIAGGLYPALLANFANAKQLDKD